MSKRRAIQNQGEQFKIYTYICHIIKVGVKIFKDYQVKKKCEKRNL